MTVEVTIKGRRGQRLILSSPKRRITSHADVIASEERRSALKETHNAPTKDVNKDKSRRAFYARKSKRILRDAGLLRPSQAELAKSACIAWNNNFYSLPKWRKLRERALKLYGKVCHKCDATENLHVDHIKCRKHFPEKSFHLTNLQILCESCNLGKGTYHSTDYRSDEHVMLAERAVGI